MKTRPLLLFSALALALGGCWGATSTEGSAVTPTQSEREVSSALQRSLEAELAAVELELLSSSDEALLDRRLVIIAALSALDRATPGEPPTTWSKDQLLAAMQAQLDRMGREAFTATLEAKRRKGSPDERAQGPRRGVLGGADREAEPGRGTALEERPKDEPENAFARDDDGREGDGEIAPDSSVQRQGAIVRTGGRQLSAEARAAIRRQLPRVQQCVPTRSVRTQVRVRAQLHQGRLRAPAVSADPPVAAAVSGCIVEALGAIEVPVDPDAPSRVVAFPFVVEAR